MAKFKKGDYVRAIKNYPGAYTQGQIYLVKDYLWPIVYTEFDDSNSPDNGRHEDNFELVAPAYKSATPATNPLPQTGDVWNLAQSYQFYVSDPVCRAGNYVVACVDYQRNIIYIVLEADLGLTPAFKYTVDASAFMASFTPVLKSQSPARAAQELFGISAIPSLDALRREETTHDQHNTMMHCTCGASKVWYQPFRGERELVCPKCPTN